MNNTEAQKRFMYKLPVSTTNRCYNCIHILGNFKRFAGPQPEAWSGGFTTESSLPLFYDCVKLEIIIGAPKQSRCPLHKEI
mgnify:CR=1 FL=1